MLWHVFGDRIDAGLCAAQSCPAAALQIKGVTVDAADNGYAYKIRG